MQASQYADREPGKTLRAPVFPRFKSRPLNTNPAESVVKLLTFRFVFEVVEIAVIVEVVEIIIVVVVVVEIVVVEIVVVKIFEIVVVIEIIVVVEIVVVKIFEIVFFVGRPQPQRQGNLFKILIVPKHCDPLKNQLSLNF
jgi:hypothetical protein